MLVGFGGGKIAAWCTAGCIVLHASVVSIMMRRDGSVVVLKPWLKGVSHLILAPMLHPLLLYPYCPYATVPCVSPLLQSGRPLFVLPPPWLFIVIKCFDWCNDVLQEATAKRVNKSNSLWPSISQNDSPMYAISHNNGWAGSICGKCLFECSCNIRLEVYLVWQVHVHGTLFQCHATQSRYSMPYRYVVREDSTYACIDSVYHNL